MDGINCYVNNIAWYSSDIAEIYEYEVILKSRVSSGSLKMKILSDE
jgi:hypothetical protein